MLKKQQVDSIGVVICQDGTENLLGNTGKIIEVLFFQLNKYKSFHDR